MYKQKAWALPGALLCGLMMAVQPTAAAVSGVPATNLTQRQFDRAQALTAAQRGLSEFQQRKQQYYSGLAPSQSAFALTDVKELSQARVGPGFEMHTVHPQELAAGRRELSGMAVPTGIWRFIVQVNEKPIGLITVEKHEGLWQAVSFGGAGLAREFDALRQAHGNADGSNLRFIRIYQAQADLLEVTSNKDGKAHYAPLKSARDTLIRQGLSVNAANANAGLVESADLLPSLQKAAAKNLAARP